MPPVHTKVYTVRSRASTLHPCLTDNSGWNFIACYRRPGQGREQWGWNMVDYGSMAL